MADKFEDSSDCFDELIYGRGASELPEIALGTSARRRFIAVAETELEPVIEEGTGYSEKSKREELEKILALAEMRENFKQNVIIPTGNCSLPSECTVFNEHMKIKAKCYEKYDFSNKERSSLAIDTKKEEILNILQKESVIVINGFTGCGKTTQVPQFILDECQKSKVPCNIVVTQPRRVAAISVASRVCHERSWILGTVVGYIVGMDCQTCAETCLTYMTTGCLLESLISKKSLEDYTHIIVDEIHEPEADTDLLLLTIRELWSRSENKPKVIMMSATANTKNFAEYFMKIVDNQPVPVPIVMVDPTEAIHPVREFYLDDLHPLLPPYCNIPSETQAAPPYILYDTYKLTAHLVASLDKQELIRFGRNKDYNNFSSARGALLVFLPGVQEIETMNRILDEYDRSCEKENFWYILPLHSRITNDEQRKVFQKPALGHQRKIILSTNIAESSITVPDIRYVIDFCLAKHVVTDPETNFCQLKLDWASKSSCTQRKGRVGRISEGVVFRMVHKRHYVEVLPHDTTPEILRSPLHHSVLRVKQLGMGAPKDLLGKLINAPNCENIVRTVLNLKEIGAMFITADGELSLEDGDLSYLGLVIGRLPIEARLGKLIMLGYTLNIFEECVIMAAGLASKNIFNYPRDKKLMAYRVKMGWDRGAFSDPICILNIYQAWKQMHRNNEFRRTYLTSRKLEKNWAFENFVDLKAIKEMDNLVNELKFQLKKMGIGHVSEIRQLEPSEKALLYLTAIHGAFYPQYFYRTLNTDEENAVKSLGVMCPYTTVKLQGFPREEPCKAYLNQLKDGLKEVLESVNDCWDAMIKVSEERVLIQFRQEAPAVDRMNRIYLPLYLAVKQRQTDSRYVLNLIDRREAEHFGRKVQEAGERMLCRRNAIANASFAASSRYETPQMIHLPHPPTPNLLEYFLDVIICHVETPSRFWCQRSDAKSRKDCNQIYRIIGPGGKNLRRFDATPNLKRGCMVMGPFQAEENGLIVYYRAKVIGIQKRGPIHEHRVLLMFIDFGNTAEVPLRELMMMPDELVDFAPLAFECRLRGIGPNLMLDPKGNWSLAAIEFLISEGLDQHFRAEVYSVVDGVTALDLLKAGNEDWRDSFSQQLVRLRLASSLDEPYLSNAYHRERHESNSNPQCLENSHRREKNAQRLAEAESIVLDYGMQLPQPGGRQHKLKGPFSPLEMKLNSKLAKLLNSDVCVAGESVNSVLLDSEPGYRYERCLIAAQLQVTSSSPKQVTARNTTLLPCIPGLPSILNLIFAPRAEFRTDKQGRTLIGAICGLGYDYTKNYSLYKSHDMVVTFDTEINQKDVLEINKIRFWMNSILGSKVYTFHSPEAPTCEHLKEIHLRILKLLFGLLKKPREYKDPQVDNSYEWKKIPHDRLLRSAQDQFDILIPQLDTVKLVH